ncbi:MAG TPA: PAS domain S-box protein [Sphingobium sp.]
METTGHVLIDGEGGILSANKAFCDIIGSPTEQIVGRLVSELTAPPDREECAIALGKLRRTGQSFSISKRFIRADHSLIWVTNTVSIMTAGSVEPVVVASIVPITDPAQYRSPAQLMRCVRFMVTARAQRRNMFSQALVSDPGWDVLMGLYIAESEGASLTGRDIAESAEIGERLIGHWIAILMECHLVEIEGEYPDKVAGDEMHLPLRLTALAHKKIEDYLAKLAIHQREFITV